MRWAILGRLEKPCRGVVTDQLQTGLSSQHVEPGRNARLDRLESDAECLRLGVDGHKETLLGVVDQFKRKRVNVLTFWVDPGQLTAGGKHPALAGVAAKLDALSPLGVLGRGYSLAWTAQGKLLRRAEDVSRGERVRVQLHEGELDCRVEEKKDRDDRRAAE